MENMENTRLSASQKHELIKDYRPLLNAIRRLQIGDKTALAAAAGWSWPTTGKAIPELMTGGAIRREEDGRYVVNASFAYYVGLSLGVSSIKLSLCDFSLRPLTREGYVKAGLARLYDDLTAKTRELADDWERHDKAICYRADGQFLGIRHRLNRAITLIVDAVAAFRRNGGPSESAPEEGFDVLGIGIAGPGVINYDTGAFVFCPNIKSLEGFYTHKMFDEALQKKMRDHDIMLYWEHDAEANILFQKEILYNKDNPHHNLKDKKNVGCVYVGTGLGLGFVLDNRLIRGGSYSAGELGHIAAPAILREPNPELPAEVADKKYYRTPDPRDPTGKTLLFDEVSKAETIRQTDCPCGKSNCLEKRLWLDVFNATESEDYLKKAKEEYLRRFKRDHPYRYRVLEEYISCILNIIINLFNFDVIIFSGRIVNWIPELKNSLETLQHSSAIFNASVACTIITENTGDARTPEEMRGGEAEPITVGAAIAVYNKDENDGKPASICWI